MRFAHISDIHLGLRLCDVRLTEDQQYILSQILNILERKKPDALLISGDIYDRPVPPEESVELLSTFLGNVRKLNIAIFMISGNHDSPERIDFANEMLSAAGVYVQGKFDGSVRKVVMRDEYGPVNFFLLPYIKPSYVNPYLCEDEKVGVDYELAVRAALKTNPPDTSERNIILAHQFVWGATRSESEELLVGFSDCIGADVFEDFDYVALGHLHKPQHITKETVRYCGTPLKYSFSEANNKKSITFIEIKEKGNVNIETVGLTPLRDVRVIRGAFEKLLKEGCDDYVRVILTDQQMVPNAYNRLRTVMPFILKLEYEELHSSGEVLTRDLIAETKTPEEIFGMFFEKIKNRPMTDEQVSIMTRIIEEGR